MYNTTTFDDVNEIIEELLEINEAIENGEPLKEYIDADDLFDKSIILSKYIQKLHDKEYY